MTRVIHTGDTHIGYRQYHSSERRADFLRAFEQVIADAIDLDVDAIVHAGDLFHDTRPELGDLLSTLEVLRTLADADIPFLAIVGNHERTRDRQWIDLFAELDLAVRLDRDGTAVRDVTVYGVDYVPASQRASLELDLRPPRTTHAAVVAHGLFEPFAHADWDTSEFLDELSCDIDALLLGDNHEPGQTRLDDTLVTYCGSTERTSAAEKGERGYNLLSFDDGRARLTRRSLDVTRSFVYVEVELAGDEGLELLDERFAERDLTDAVVIVHIDGDGGDVTPAAVEERALEAGALVARIDDRRDRETDTEHEVSFADPSRAIAERLRSMAFSAATHDVESIVRDDDIAAANVRDRVTERVRTLLDEDLDAFEPGAAREEDETGGADDGSEVDAADDPATAPRERDAEVDAEGRRASSTDDDAPQTETDGEDQRSLMEYR